MAGNKIYIGDKTDAHENHNKVPQLLVTGHMLAKRSCMHRAVVFKVADALKVTFCVKTEASEFLSPVALCQYPHYAPQS